MTRVDSVIGPRCVTASESDAGCSAYRGCASVSVVSVAAPQQIYEATQQVRGNGRLLVLPIGPESVLRLLKNNDLESTDLLAGTSTSRS